MSPRTIKQVFDPFFTTKRAKGGTGLGLSIVYRIVEEHGGKISVFSKVGEGTVFTIKIPYVQIEAAGTASELAPESTETAK
jgi:two-component system cell cycle sensor histidine kinase/response regulator CckA